MQEVAAVAEPMPVTGVALIAAAVLHAFVAALAIGELPVSVPITFDLDGEPVAASTVGVTGLLLLVVPLGLAGAAAVAAVRRTRR